MICWETDGRFQAICCSVIAKERVHPQGLCEEEAGARRVDGFINHGQAEAYTEICTKHQHIFMHIRYICS